MPVGKVIKEEAFRRHELQIKKGDRLTLYTDGFANQFGGPKGKKFKCKQLNELLVNLNRSAPEKQKEELESTLLQWKGKMEQVDDICIIGIHF